MPLTKSKATTNGKQVLGYPKIWLNWNRLLIDLGNEVKLKQQSSELAKSINQASQKQGNKLDTVSMTKPEHKTHYNECKQVLRKSWDLISELDSPNEMRISVSMHYKRYTIQDRTIFV